MDEKDLLSVDEFAEAIKLKYPEYKDVDNATLTAKMIEKYPEYKDRVSMGLIETEQLTPEMMETGQRDAAPAYAMTDAKYAAEKKSPTESPLPAGEFASTETDYSAITPELVSGNEEDVVPKLKELYGDDFEFEEAQSGHPLIPTDAVLIKSKKTGNKEIFKLDAFTDAGDVESAAAIKAFMKKNISDTEEELTVKFEEKQRDFSQKYSELDKRSEDLKAMGALLETLAKAGKLNPEDPRIEEYSNGYDQLELDYESTGKEYAKSFSEFDEKMKSAPSIEKRFFSGDDRIIDALPVTKGDIGKALEFMDDWSENYSVMPNMGDFLDGIGYAISTGEAQAELVTLGNRLMKKANSASSSDIQRLIEVNKAMNTAGQSNEMKQYDKDYDSVIESGGSWVEAWITSMVKNPQAAAEMTLSSFVAMANKESLLNAMTTEAAAATAGVAAGGVVGAPATVPAAMITAVPVAMGIAGATVEVGISVSDGIREYIDEENERRSANGEEEIEFNEESIRKVLSDKEAFGKIRAKALTRGTTIGLVDAVMTKLGAKIGGKVFGKTGSRVVQAGATAPIEMIGEGIGEGAAQYLSDGKLDFKEIAGEMSGGAYGTATTMISSITEEGEYTVNGVKTSRDKINEIIRDASPDDLAKIEIEIVGDKKTRDAYNSKIEDKEILDEIPSNITGEARKEALALEKERKRLKASGITTFGKEKKLSEVNRRLKELYESTEQDNAIQEQGPEGVDVQESAADGTEVGEGDVRQEPTRESDVEKQPTEEKITVEEEVQPVTEETLQDLQNVTEPVIRGLAVKKLNGETLTEQEQQVYDSQAEAVDQMASDIQQVFEAEKTGQQTATTPTTAAPIQADTETIGRVRKQAERARKAISRILPDVDIVLHDTVEDFESAVPPAKGKAQGTGGAFYDGKIHINLSGANARTVAHEVFHAVILRGYDVRNSADMAKVTVLTDKMLAAIKRSADPSVLNKRFNDNMTIGEYIESFATKKDKKGRSLYDASVQSEEQLAELAGYLAESFDTLDVNAKTVVKAWIGRIAEVLGINKILGTDIYNREMSDKDAIDLLNTIAGSVAKGKEIKKAKELKSIFGDEKIAETVAKTGIIKLPSIPKVHLDVLKDAAKKAGVSVEQFVASAIDKTKSTYKNASDAVKRAIDAVIKAMRIDLSVADIIDKIPKPALKKAIDSAVSRLPKIEADVLKDAAKKADMAIEDFVFAVSSKTYDASKKVVEIANKVAETVAANGRRIVLIASMVGIPSGATVGVDIDGYISAAYQYAKDAGQSAIIEMLESNETVSKAAEAVYDSGIMDSVDPVAAQHLERALMITGIVEPSNEVQDVQVREEEEIDYANEEYLVEQTYTEDLGSPNSEPDAAKFRVQFPLESGKEVVLIPTHEGREASGKKQTEGVKFIMHQTLDYDPVNNVTHDYNSGYHRTNKSFDGFVPVLIKKKGERGVITYKRYSEINDSTDVMMGPLRQFKFTDLDWDGNGTPIMKSAREINLKNGKKTPYRQPNPTYNGRPISEGGTDLIWTPAAAGKDGYGKFQGGGVVFIFEDSNGNRFAREFAGSINAMKAEGESIAKTFDIPAESITIGTHDVGSFSKKLRAENGVITYEDIDAMNSDNPTGGAVAVAVEETGMVSSRFQKTNGRLQDNAVVENYVSELERTKASDPEQYWSVDAVSKESAENGTVVSVDGGFGLVGKDGDVKGVFKTPESKEKGVADKILQKAIEVGAKKLDNFDGYLTKIYERNGFRVVSRIPFNEEYAPDGWNKAKHGTPDVVAMVYDPNNDLKIEEKRFEDYDEGIAYRDSFVDGLSARMQNNEPINATIDFQSRSGRTFSTSKTFNDQKHMDNYIRFMEKKGNKEIGTDVSKQAPTTESKPSKRIFANKAVTTVGNVFSGEAKLEIGRLSPFMIDGQEFAKMTKIDIPSDNKSAFTERDLYTKAVDLAVREGLGGVIVSKDLFNEAAVDTDRFDVRKKGDDIVVEPKKENVLTARFQANYTDPQTDVKYEYDKNIDAWKKLEEVGRITKDKTIKYINGKLALIHAPDSAFSGTISRSDDILIEGKGGLYFPIKFSDMNMFWASTRRSAEKMAQQLNEMASKNNGRAYMVLTSAPYDKVLSSTIAANGVLDLFTNKANDRKIKIKKGDILSAIISAANFKKEVVKKDANGNVKKKIEGLNMGLNKTTSFDDAVSLIKEKLGPDESSFADRKAFVLSLANEMATLINESDKDTANFFFSVFDNPYFKGSIAKNTGRYRASEANIAQAIGYMMTEPSLRPMMDTKKFGNKGATGMAYAIIEAEGPFEPAELKGHESYPIGIRSNGPVSLHLLEYPVLWTDFSVDPSTERVIGNNKERASSIMPSNAGISMNPLMIDTSNVDVADSPIALRFQSPNATGFTVYDVINDMRGKGYTDSAISLFLSRQINPDTNKKFTAKEIKSALDVPISIESSLPSAFGDVQGGVAQGQKMFTEVMDKLKRSIARTKVVTKAKVRAKAHKLLMEHPDFDKQTPLMKKKLILALDTALGTTADKAIQAEISAIKKIVSGARIGARELRAAQVRLRTMIRKNLPDVNYSKKEVNKLIKMVTDATPETIQQVTDDIVSSINEKRSENTITAIEKLLKTSFARVESGRKKGTKVALAFDEALSKVKGVLTDLQAAETDEATFNSLMDDLRTKRDDIMNKTSRLTEQDMADLMTYEFALQYGSSFSMENSDRAKVDALATSLEMIQDFMQAGRSSLKEQLRIAHEAYLQQFNDAFTDITGIDLTGMTEQEQEEARRSFEVSAEQRGKNLGVVKNAIMSLSNSISTFMSKNEDLTGLMDIISKSVGDMFGGPLQEMVTQRFDDSTIVFKRGKMEMQKTLQSKMREIFGEKWHEVTTVDNARQIETGVFIGETELIMSQNEIYYYYNQAKDPANAPSFEKMWGEDWRAKMDALEAHMSQETKAWADWQVNEFYPQMYNRYNEVYRRIYRTNLPWNQFYAGRIYREGAQEQTIDMLESGRNLQMSVAGGSTKMRRANNQKIQRMSGDQVLGNYIQEMETFRAYQETVRDVGKLFGNKMIKDAITKAYGKDFLNLLQGQLKVIANGRRQEVLRSKLLSGGTRAFIFAKLGYNMSLVWKQLTSIPTYANDIGYRRWSAGVASMIANPKATIATAKELYANSIYLQERYANDFLGVVDVYQQTQATMFPEGTKGEFLMNRVTDFVMKTGMAYTKAGDAAAIFMGGMPNYNHYKAEFKKRNPSATEQQAIDYAVKRFERDTKRTQQSGDIQDRDYWQTQGDVVKGMNLFVTSPRQYWRKSMSGYRQLARKMTGAGASKGTVADNLRTIATYRILMPVLYSWASMGFPPLWDLSDDEEESLMWAAIMGNMNALFVVGNFLNGIANYVQGKPWAANMPQLALFQYAEQLITGLQKIDKAKTEETKDKHKQKLIFDTMNMVVPQKNLDKTFGNWYRTATGDQEFDWRKMAGYADYTADQIGKDEKTEEAMEKLKKAQEKLNKKKRK